MVYTQNDIPSLREDFCYAVSVLFNENDFLDFIENDGCTDGVFDFFISCDDECYIINRLTGEYINWYKLTHIGREIHTNIQNPTRTKFIEFLKVIKELGGI